MPPHPRSAFQNLVESPRSLSLGGALIAAYIRLVYRTSRIVRDPADTDEALFAQHPQIFAMWHGQGLMLPKIKPETRMADVRIVVSNHIDGELTGQALTRLGMGLVRGAGAGTKKKDKGGASALRNALRALAEGATVAMTADVPPGPARVVGPGIVMMARLSGRPVVPCAMATKRFVALPTWSRFTINLPFSTLAVVVGKPIPVPRDADADGARVAIERELDVVTERAYALAGSRDPLDRNAPATQSRGLFLSLYRLATRIAEPFAPLLLRLRQGQGKEDVTRREERYGGASRARPAGFLAWFHAASVGEANAVLPLIEAIGAERPDVRVLLTTGTVTSAQLARDRLPAGAIHQFVPLDTPNFVGRFLDHWRPDLAVFAESEIWPNLLAGSKARDIPLALVNGRMSRGSFRRWRRFGASSRSLFSAFDLVLAQNAGLARRFETLGARRVIDVGNLKIDSPPPPVPSDARSALETIFAGRTLVLAASTHPGEEAIVAAAHRALRRIRPEVLTIIVPRHPERGPELEAALTLQGFETVRRSAGAAVAPTTDIYLADTIGELGLFYALADLALIGGSLVPKGGQNPVEAIKLGTVVLTGPNWQNFRDAYHTLITVGGCREVKNAAELSEAMERLLGDAAARADMQARAEAAIASLSGALPKTLAELDSLLPPRNEMRHAS